MTRQAHELPYRRESTDYTERAFDRPDRDLEISDDPLLAFLYVFSEWAITVLGPIFWICLMYFFLVGELGN
jgi:hypothetical protein